MDNGYISSLCVWENDFCLIKDNVTNPEWFFSGSGSDPKSWPRKKTIGTRIGLREAFPRAVWGQVTKTSDDFDHFKVQYKLSWSYFMEKKRSYLILDPTARTIIKRSDSKTLGDFSIFFLLYSALLHLPPLRFRCADGCWDRTQDRCNWYIGSQTI